MQKIYLSIIALLTLTLFVTFNYTNNEKNTQESQNEGKSPNSIKVFKPYETYGITINTSEFKDYFSGIEAKRNLLEGQHGVATKTENIPPEKHKEVALGLLLEAKKAISAAGNLGTPKLENQDFFQPTDNQLRELIKLRNNKLATNIVQRIVILRDANDLIDNEVINEQIKAVTERLVRIEIYEKDTLYKFSLAYNEYKQGIILILKMTQELG